MRRCTEWQNCIQVSGMKIGEVQQSDGTHSLHYAEVQVRIMSRAAMTAYPVPITFSYRENVMGHF